MNSIQFAYQSKPLQLVTRKLEATRFDKHKKEYDDFNKLYLRKRGHANNKNENE